MLLFIYRVLLFADWYRRMWKNNCRISAPGIVLIPLSIFVCWTDKKIVFLMIFKENRE